MASSFSKLEKMQPMVEYYYQHPAYGNYPVVNVSKDQMQGYCNWLSDILNENLGEYPL